MLSVCGVSSAFLLTGTDKIISGFGNGDCLFLDFQRQIFAVADATERYPFSSRKLLESLRHEILNSSVKESIGKIWSKQQYNHRSTLSCIWIEEECSGIKVSIFHGGDSVIIIGDKNNIAFQSRTNMFFAGRSKVMPDILNVNLTNKNQRIILATDGFNDFMRNGFSVCQIFNHSIHEIAEIIYSKKEYIKNYDDIGFIIIDPFCFTSYPSDSIIMGGTTANQEKEYLNLSCKSKDYGELLKISGISVYT